MKYIGRYKYLVPLSLLMALVSTALTLYVPILIGEAIDGIVGEGRVDFRLIGEKLLLSAILIGITAACTWIMSAVNNRIAYHVSEDTRNEAFSKIEKLPLSYVDTTSHGDIVNRIINDTDRFAEGLLLGFTQVFTGVLTIVGTLIFMLVLCWQIALVVVFLTPLSIFIAKFIGSRTFNMFKSRSECEAEAASLIDEMLSGQKTVRAFGYEDRASARFREVGDRLEKSTLDAIFFSSLTNPTTRFVNSMVYAAVALVGALIVISNGGVGALLTIGEFSVLLSYTNQYTKPFNEISGIFAEFQNALASAERVFDLIEKEPESSDAELPALEHADGNLALTDVAFSYSKDKPLIEGLNLSVSKGETVAIVGPTGCGKTTLINLLMRFYDVDSGKIELDGKDIRNITRNSLRSSFGMVLQDTWLFKGTIKDNIRYGVDDATDEQIEQAAKSANIHDYIMTLPKKYETELTEDGTNISQGQRQLITIARALLKDPKILILDEATSSVDTRTELLIQDAMQELMKGRTSFVIAHRLSTIRTADNIVVMRHGKIVEQGTHKDLLEADGFYAMLYNSQFTGGIPEDIE